MTVSQTSSVTATGTVRHLSNPDSNCVCCDGPHVFARFVDADDAVGPECRRWRASFEDPSTVLDPTEMLYHAIRPVPAGTRVRVTVEILDDPAPDGDTPSV
jgi:hypothetical protein